MAKYNKKRNTAFLFEVLISEAVECAVKKDKEKRKKINEIIKKYFVDTALAKELNTYRAIYEAENLTLEDAQKILNEASRRFDRFDKKKIFNLQTKLITEMNKLDKGMFNNFIKPYRILASVNQFLVSDDIKINEKLSLEDKIISLMCEEKNKQQEEVETLDNITYNLFVEKFNKKYSGLLSEQKELLKYYIAESLRDSLDFKTYLYREIDRLKNKLNESFEINEIKQDTDMNKKTKAVLEKLNEISKREFNDEDFGFVLKVQELIREMFEDGN